MKHPAIQIVTDSGCACIRQNFHQKMIAKISRNCRGCLCKEQGLNCLVSSSYLTRLLFILNAVEDLKIEEFFTAKKTGLINILVRFAVGSNMLRWVFTCLFCSRNRNGNEKSSNKISFYYFGLNRKDILQTSFSFNNL